MGRKAMGIKVKSRTIKIFSAITLCMSISSAAYANTLTLKRPITEGNKITISGTTDVVGSEIYIQLYRKGAELLDTGSMYASMQVRADDNGDFSLECEMPDYDRNDSEKSINGDFTFLVKAPGIEAKTMDLSYISPSSRTIFFENLNTALSSETALESFILDKNNTLMLKSYNILIEDFAGFNSTVKKKACELIIKNSDEYKEENISDINEIIIAMRLNSAESTEAMKKLIESEDIKSRIKTDFDAADAKMQEWALKVLKDYSGKNAFESVADFDRIYNIAICLKEVNEAHYTKLFGILSGVENEKLLGLDKNETFKSTKALDEYARDTVMKKVKDVSSEFLNADALNSAVTSAYNSYNSGSGTGGNNDRNNGGGTGGGKKPSTGGITISGATGEDAKEEDKPNISEYNYFDDLENASWAKEAVNSLAALGIVSGNGDGKFRPNEDITRAEFVKMLMTAMNMVDEKAKCVFDDVPEDDWAYKYIASAYKYGITSGNGDGSFGKDKPITRQEAAVFLHCTAIRAFVPLEENECSEFADIADIAEWAKRSVKVMQSAGLMSGMGDGNFMPHGRTTRAQAAKMVYDLYKKLS